MTKTLSARLLALVCAVWLALGLAGQALAEGAGAKSPGASSVTRVRVAFFHFPGYQTVDQEGRRSGYGYEFLQLLAAHCNWVYDYVAAGCSYADALEMLSRGEVDLVTSVTKTPAREKLFLFSDSNIGRASTILTVKAGSSRVAEGDRSTYNGLVIGMLAANSKNENFAAFARENGFTFRPVYYRSQRSLAEALQKGAVDAVVTGSLRVLDREWLVESFDEIPFYACVRKGRPDLLRQLNQALDELDLHRPNWRGELHRKYFSQDHGTARAITGDDRAFLQELEQSGRRLKVLVSPGRAPYSYLANGEMRGILPAVFRLMARRLSIPYEFIVLDHREDYYRLRAEGSADIILDFASDYFLAEQMGLKITPPYFTVYLTRLTRRDFPGQVRRLAVNEQNLPLTSFVSGNYGDGTDYVYYSKAEECVDAVLSGHADATLLFSYMADKFIRADARKQFDASMEHASTMLSCAVRADGQDSTRVLSLLDKGLGTLTSADLSLITRQEVDSAKPEERVGFLDYMIYENPMAGYGALVLLICFLGVCAGYWQRSLNSARLTRRVAEATSCIEAQKEELEQALHRAESANRAKTTFLNNMSHDIRTPMNAVMGFTTLALRHLDNRERTRDYLGKISQASSHLLSLLNDVLDMSRIESGKLSIEERPENLAEILQSLRNIIQSDVHARRLELFIDTCDVTNEIIFCDRLRLNQVLLNLMSNAIKFTPPGGKVVLHTAQLPSEKPGRGIYVFQVSDTGVGMSEDFARTIFEPFTQEKNPLSSGARGTGLGMAITKNIVDMMGGTISLRTARGKGSEFTVRLEFRFAGEAPALTALDELKGLRALVVDDDMVSCQNVSRMLRRLGLRAEWSLSGREAVVRTEEAVEMEEPFGVYIIDWSMPDMNGVETVRRIRRIIGHGSPIILMSAYDWSEIEAEAREAGVTGFIGKPLFASDLHRSLEQGMGRVRAAAKTQDDGKKFQGRRILLAEDNAFNREIAVELLEAAGFAVESAENGREACEKLSAAEPGHFDLVLMDVQMPVMDGYAATRAIRSMADPVRASVPVIALTANAFEEDREKARAAGMNGHLGKPVDVDKMLNLLGEILQEKQARPGQGE